MSQQQPQIQIYQAESGSLEIRTDFDNTTIWITQNQMSQLFEVTTATVNEHIKNIYKTQELDENSTVRKFRIVRQEGSREVQREVMHYNLDMVISVGYRVNSKKATKFRQWATTVLKDYLLKGYSINQKLLETKKEQITEIRQTLDFLVKSGKTLEAGDPFLEVLNRYTDSLITLNQFDEDRLEIGKGQKGVQIEIAEFRKIIAQTKRELIAKNEATELFGQEYEGKFESSIATIYQSFAGQEMYPTLEEKAANLFYLIVKNHGFVDGNKRIGSILFVYYLAKNNFLKRENGELKINDNTLVALALLIAQSKPDDKEILIKLVIKLIQN